MAVENENIPMVVDGEIGEEDFTADAAAEALEEAFDAGDFPTVAEMATLRATVNPRIDTRVPYAFGSLVSPPAAPSRANSHGAPTGGYVRYIDFSRNRTFIQFLGIFQCNFLFLDFFHVILYSS
jgi:hypothetical protein